MHQHLPLKLNPVLEPSQGFQTLKGSILTKLGIIDSRIFAGSTEGIIYSWLLNDSIHSTECQRFIGHSKAIVALHVGDQHLYSASEDGTLRLWNLESATCFKTILAHPGAISSMLVTRDGRCFTGGHDRSIIEWDLDTGKRKSTMIGSKGSILVLTSHPNYKDYLFSAGNDKVVRIWNVVSGKCMKTLDPHADAIFGIFFKEKTLIAVSPNEIRLHNLRDGSIIKQYPMENLLGFHCCESLFVGTFANSVRVWDPSHDSLKTLITCQGDQNGTIMASELFHYAPSKYYVCACLDNGHVTIWKLETKYLPVSTESVTPNAIRILKGDLKKAQEQLKKHEHYGFQVKGELALTKTELNLVKAELNHAKKKLCVSSDTLTKLEPTRQELSAQKRLLQITQKAHAESLNFMFRHTDSQLKSASTELASFGTLVGADSALFYKGPSNDHPKSIKAARKWESDPDWDSDSDEPTEIWWRPDKSFRKDPLWCYCLPSSDTSLPLPKLSKPATKSSKKLQKRQSFSDLIISSFFQAEPYSPQVSIIDEMDDFVQVNLLSDIKKRVIDSHQVTEGMVSKIFRRKSMVSLNGTTEKPQEQPTTNDWSIFSMITGYSTKEP